MLVNNASGAIVQYLFTGEASNNMQFVGDYPNGNHSVSYIDSNLIFAGLRNFVTNTSTSNIDTAKSFIILGSGNTEVTGSDCKLSQPYATNQYSVSSVSSPSIAWHRCATCPACTAVWVPWVVVTTLWR